MSSLVLHPRAAPADCLRVWLGVFDAGAAPPNVALTLDGDPIAAVPVRPLTPAHVHGSRSFTGVFELTVPVAPGVPHRIAAHAAASSSPALVVRSVPNGIPTGDWLRILLTSCYHQAEDRGGLAARACQNIPSAERPNLTLLMGDQVYLDLPTLNNFPDDEAKLAVAERALRAKAFNSGLPRRGGRRIREFPRGPRRKLEICGFARMPDAQPNESGESPHFHFASL